MSNINRLFIFFRFCQIIGATLLFLGTTPFLLLFTLLLGLLFSISKQWEELTSLRPMGGYANWLTLIRGILLVFLLLQPTSLSNSTFAILGLFISIADFFDGFIARRLNIVTKIGSYLDEEMDAFYFIVIGYILYQNKFCGAYILLPGLAKYIKDLLLTVLSHWFTKPVRMPIAKWIAGSSFVLYLTAFVFPSNVYPYLTMPSVIALVLSLFVEMVIRFSGFSKN